MLFFELGATKLHFFVSWALCFVLNPCHLSPRPRQKNAPLQRGAARCAFFAYYAEVNSLFIAGVSEKYMCVL